jgi:hypothetical protein
LRLAKGICTPGVLIPSFGVTGAGADFTFLREGCAHETAHRAKKRRKRMVGVLVNKTNSTTDASFQSGSEKR